MGTKDVGDCFVSFNVRSVSSSSMARSIRRPWVLLILILISLPGEYGVGASAAPPPPGDSCNSHASSAAGKIAVEIIGGLLSGVIFVGALYRLAAEVAQPLRFFICHTGGINQEGKNFPERLYDEMTQSLKLKFFIEVFLDRMVLRDGLLFPSQILKELKRTQVSIVLVTPDFFTRKWPMVELVYFVESSERISDMRRVLLLFYRMTVRQVHDNLRDGVWEGEWRKMSTGGDHPLSVERCRHAVRELCKYKGVEYSGSDHDRGRDREYIRDILKRVGKIVCEEIWKNIRARNLENSSWRGHAPDRQKIGTLSTKSTISSSQDPNSLDEDDRQIERALSEENQHVDNEVGNPLTKLESMKGNGEEYQYIDKEVGNRLTKVEPIQKGDKKEYQHVDREVGNRLTKLEFTKGDNEEYQHVDKEVGNRLTKLESTKFVPRTNQSFPTLEDASADHQRLAARLVLYAVTEQKIEDDGNCQVRLLSSPRAFASSKLLANIDKEVGNRHTKLESTKFVPRTNQSFPTLEDASADHQRLADRLILYAFTEQKIEDDGNCQFRALSYQLFCTPSNHEYVRKVVVKQLEAYPEVYAKYVPMEYSEYLKNMAKDAEWGDHVTLQAASDHFGVRIYLLTSLRHIRLVEILPADQKLKREIYLSFWAEVHYNSMLFNHPVSFSPLFSS